MELAGRGKANEVRGPAPPSSTDVVATIRELAILRDDGILTPEVFEEKKRDLLKRLTGR